MVDTGICVLPGHPKASGLSAARQQSVAAVQRQMRGGGQVPADLHAAEAATGSGQDAGVCGSSGQVLQAQTLFGTVWYPCLCSQLRAAHSVQVSRSLTCELSNSLHQILLEVSSRFTAR